MDNLDKIIADFNLQISQVKNHENLEEIRIHFLGKKGLVTEAFANLKNKRCKHAQNGQFCHSIIIIKTISDEEFKPLFELFQNNYFEESRKPYIGCFIDNFRTFLGQQ